MWDDALEKGMVRVMAIRDDYDFNMTWLDSTFPAASTAPGAKHGAPMPAAVPELFPGDLL